MGRDYCVRYLESRLVDSGRRARGPDSSGDERRGANLLVELLPLAVISAEDRLGSRRASRESADFGSNSSGKAHIK